MKLHTYRFIIITTFIVLNSNFAQAQRQVQKMDMEQTLSDGAQRTTIAFDALAFLSGDFCCCTFLPPGKVSDYFGFQYLRDNDKTGMGHNTDFLTKIADNMLHVLTDNQKNQLITLAKNQVELINQYAYKRLPLISAFNKGLVNDVSVDKTVLNENAVANYSASLYKIDAQISIERARVFGSIIKAMNTNQKSYIDSLSQLGIKYWPNLPEQIDKRQLDNKEFVAIMTYASEMCAWYLGNTNSDVYFCPERQGNYFGGFYLKDAPAMGHHGYSIATNLTHDGGEKLLDILTPEQAIKITRLVDIQRIDMEEIVKCRTDISKLLRAFQTNEQVDTAKIRVLSEKYGALDGHISYLYAKAFIEVGHTLSSKQRDEIMKLRNLKKYPCNGAFIYSENIEVPNLDNVDYFFKNK